MTYSNVDPVLHQWARRHGLHVASLYRDDEVRSVAVVDDSGGEYQIFLTPPDAAGRLTVTASTRRRPRVDIEANLASLESALEQAYRLVEGWISAAGHTRSPVL